MIDLDDVKVSAASVTGIFLMRITTDRQNDL